MIPLSYIMEWSHHVPWNTYEQVEQDLIICRSIIEIFSDPILAENLAFRGGTALHKIFVQPQVRYSEDIDLVQIKSEPIKETVLRIQTVLSFLGESSVKPRKDGFQILFRFQPETSQNTRLRLKVEINTREHFNVLGYQHIDFSTRSNWHQGTCKITTYSIEELLGTKLRALYQRKKGRDLFDLYMAIQANDAINFSLVIFCYQKYMLFSVNKIPTQKEYFNNIESKIMDSEFTGDTKALIRPSIKYDPFHAWDLIKSKITKHT